MQHGATLALTQHHEEVTLRTEALDQGAVSLFIRNAVKTGEVDLSTHARTQMNARNFDLNDLLLVLSNGEVAGPPEYDEQHQNYKYRITGPTLDDDLATAIVVLLGHRTVYVITIFGS